MLALAAALFSLTGCAKTGGKVVTLYNTDALRIEREGAETRIFDLDGGAEYTFTTRRVRTEKGKAAQIGTAKTAADTETITIQTAQGVIVVTVKDTGETLYIR